jgi:hypothetical protein
MIAENPGVNRGPTARLGAEFTIQAIKSIVATPTGRLDLADNRATFVVR